MPPRKRPPANDQSKPAGPANPGVHLQAFLEYLDAECGMAANSIDAYRRDLRRFCDWYRERGPAALAEIDLRLLQSYLHHLHDERLAATSIARHLVSIKMFLRYLVLEGLLQESVADLLSSPKLWSRLPQVLSPEMVDRLIAAPAAEDRYPLRDRAVLALLYATGCRASEVANLTLRDVRLEERYCRCLGKGNKERIVSLSPVAQSALAAYLRHERPQLLGRRDSDMLFISRSGRPLTRIVIWTLVKKYAARVGASRKISPHTLRHSFATHMLAGGADIRTLQEMLGHANIRTTQIYTHVDHTRLKAVHERCHPRG